MPVKPAVLEKLRNSIAHSRAPGDTWKNYVLAKINIGDVWKDVAGMQINIGDTWKTVF